MGLRIERPQHRGESAFPRHHGLWLLALGLVLLWSLDAACFMLGCDDHWWHLLTGGWIAERGTIPRVDPFSFTHAQKPWINWEWLGSLVLYGAYSLGGTQGLVGLRAVVLAATGSVLLLHARARLRPREMTAGSIAVLVGLVLLALLVVLARVGARPHALVFPLLALTAYLADLLRGRSVGLPMFALPAVTALWVNTHPSWPLALVVVGSAWMNARSEGAPATQAWRWWRWPATAAAMLLAAMINPYGAFLVHRSYDVFAHGVSREWVSLPSMLAWDGPLAAKLGLLFGGLALLSLPAAWRGRRPGDFVLVLACAALAWRHVRFTPHLAILALPVVVQAVAGGLARMPARRALSLAAMVAATLVAVTFARLELADFGLRRGTGIDRRANLAGAVDLMERHDLKLRAVSTETCSNAYMAFRRWPQQRAFVDGRIPTLYRRPFVERFHAMFTPERFFAAARRYGLGLVVVRLVSGHPERLRLAEALERDPDWDLIYFDRSSLMFVRCSQAPVGLCAKEGFKLFGVKQGFATEALAPKNLAQLVNELERAVENAPADPTVARALYELVARHRTSLSPRVREALAEVVARHPEATALAEVVRGLSECLQSGCK